MKNVAKISIGLNHVGFITDQMQLYMSGDNSYGQLGLGTEKIQTAGYATMIS